MVLIGLMCGALASPPLVRTASILAEPAILGAMGGLPCPWSPWHMAHLALNSGAASCANMGTASMERVATAVAMRSFIGIPLSFRLLLLVRPGFGACGRIGAGQRVRVQFVLFLVMLEGHLAVTPG